MWGEGKWKNDLILWYLILIHEGTNVLKSDQWDKKVFSKSCRLSSFRLCVHVRKTIRVSNKLDTTSSTLMKGDLLDSMLELIFVKRNKKKPFCNGDSDNFCFLILCLSKGQTIWEKFTNESKTRPNISRKRLKSRHISCWCYKAQTWDSELSHCPFCRNEVLILIHWLFMDLRRVPLAAMLFDKYVFLAVIRIAP